MVTSPPSVLVHPSTTTATRPSSMSRQALFATVSALALLVHATAADALCLGRCSAGGAASATTAAATSAIMSAQQAALATQQSMNSLSAATRAVQAIQAVQSAARNLALGTPSSVPNGLAPGGLVPDSGLASTGVANPVTTWVGANTPTQTTSNGQTNVDIQQTAAQAILNWNTLQHRRPHHAELQPAGQCQLGGAQPRRPPAPRRARSSAT